MNLRERILSRPMVYQALKQAVVPGGLTRRLVAEHFTVRDGGRVLDLGCGYGDFAPYFVERSEYIGVDHNDRYLRSARRRYGKLGARFMEADVTDPAVRESGPFDLVMMAGVLHHLPSPTVREMMSLVRPLLGPGGRFVALEPVFDPEQSLTARLTIAADRGRFVRDEDGYARLIGEGFSTVRTSVVRDLLRIPYTHVVISAEP
jgi:SAM-dependent methyltransferase